VAPVRVDVGLGGGEPAATVPREKWKLLIQTRRSNCITGFRHDCRSLVFYIQDGAANAWLGYADRESYIRDGLGLEPSAVELAVEGLSRVINEPISFDAAVVLGMNGGARVKGQSDIVRVKLSKRAGNAADYTIARLRRDKPQLAARVERGELSANAAAIEAAFRRKPLTVPATVDGFVAALTKHVSAAQWLQIRARIDAELIGTGTP